MLVQEPLLAKMTSRSRDRLPRVRSAAVPGICRLQSCVESDDIRRTIATLLESDSSPLVRKAVLDNLSPEEWNIELILSRTSDTSEDVRRACYKLVAEKIDLQSLTISQRVTLLRRGRLDRSSHVRKEFLQSLVYRGWLEGSCGGDFYRLCELLDPETYAEDIVPILCEVEERFAKPIVAIDLNHLTKEAAVLLLAFAKRSADNERLSQVFPSLKSYAECLKYYKQDDFILSCLIQVFNKLDLSDEAGRRDLISTLREDFLEDSQIPDRHYPGLVRALVSSMGSQSSAAGLVAELLIADGSDWSSEQAAFRALKIVEGLLLASTPQNDPEVFFSSLIDNVVLKGLVNSSVDIRSVAIRCLSIYCLMDKTEKTASTNVLLFLQVLDNDVLPLQVIALEAIVDILLRSPPS
uniref:Nuclear condensin complex subunit 3 C-terminal domain-containing protein n=1 Tax=Rhodosorus marinus TaxID=101924 RepID=A0A7S2ZCN2_9RHOD|mmetsp:Transcript_1395/g.4161  ORF Transcript_1395/g.4161 Transcript_1395/m.4161 type:complete len:409 (+) Transcript_1395:770-1996(+)